MAIRIPADALRVFFLCIIWYSISSTNSVVGKKLLNEFPHPTTVAFVQVLCTALFLGPTLMVWKVPKAVAIPRSAFIKLIVPLAFGKALAAVSAYFSIWRVPVSYAHTVLKINIFVFAFQATMPIFTVILSRILLGVKHTTVVYCSLIPIVCGVMIATVTEISFDMIGLLSALIATITFSVQNIFTKKAFKELQINHLRLLYLLARIATVLLLPFWALYDLRKILTYSDLAKYDAHQKKYTLPTHNKNLNHVNNHIANGHVEEKHVTTRHHHYI
ncbi:hypothetical protein QZH41_008765 [Actinostola sp. cb2023]|nr:hypothetical protein QZH41_008765 [Actinostola sp. cb2023]